MMLLLTLWMGNIDSTSKTIRPVVDLGCKMGFEN
jgi:hypothetical protein